MADRLGVRFENTDRLFRRLKDWGEDAIAGAESAIFIEAEQIMAQAKQLTPVDLGNLRASGHVQLPERKGDTVSVEFGFGGPAGSGNQGGESNDEDVGYAVRVHFDLEAFHKVGQPLFLQIPIDERRSGMERRLARRIERRAKRIVGLE